MQIFLLLSDWARFKFVSFLVLTFVTFDRHHIYPTISTNFTIKKLKIKETKFPPSFIFIRYQLTTKPYLFAKVNPLKLFYLLHTFGFVLIRKSTIILLKFKLILFVMNILSTIPYKQFLPQLIISTTLLYLLKVISVIFVIDQARFLSIYNVLLIMKSFVLIL